MVGVQNRSHRPPHSCDFLGLALPDRPGSAPAAANTDDVDGDTDPGRFLVWLIDDRETVVVRAAAGLPAAVQVARAYCAAWGGQVHHIEDPHGSVLAPSEWAPLLSASAPLPYLWTVELRTSATADGHELVSALWTSTDLDEALRWRASMPDDLRSRTLIVSNAPDGHHPHRRPITAPPTAAPPATDATVEQKRHDRT
jgi:hypothetical protein